MFKILSTPISHEGFVAIVEEPLIEKQTRLIEKLSESSPTTFNNTPEKFIGRDAYFEKLGQYFKGMLSLEKLLQYSPEDYARLGTPASALLEHKIAEKHTINPNQVFTFPNQNFAFISVLMDAKLQGKTVITCGNEPNLSELEIFGLTYDFQTSPPIPKENQLILYHAQKGEGCTQIKGVDAIIDENALIINNPDHISLESIHTLRKRFLAPPPQAECIATLNGTTKPPFDPIYVGNICKNLHILAGNKLEEHPVEPDALISTVGLSASAAAIAGIADHEKKNGSNSLHVIQASTCYGGSSQQTDIMTDLGIITSSKYDIQGDKDVLSAIVETLEGIKSNPNETVMLHIEYPTNPDMKEVDLKALESTINDFSKVTQKKVILVLDTSLAPSSKPLFELAPNNPVIVFNSMSKALSGGLTTGGSLIGNPAAAESGLIAAAKKASQTLGSDATASQLAIFNTMIPSTDERVQKAHENAKIAKGIIETAVKFATNDNAWSVNFVEESSSVPSSTFSFNLPPSIHVTNDALAQYFVDKICEKEGFKPCVSFGQSNDLVYVTVPATSTQGVISSEIKAKQAKGGVQLVRMTFPNEMDHKKIEPAMTQVISKLYST